MVYPFYCMALFHSQTRHRVIVDFSFESTSIEPCILKLGKSHLCPHTEVGLDLLAFGAVAVGIIVTSFLFP